MLLCETRTAGFFGEGVLSKTFCSNLLYMGEHSGQATVSAIAALHPGRLYPMS